MISAVTMDSQLKDALSCRKKSFSPPIQHKGHISLKPFDGDMSYAEKARRCLDYLSPKRCDQYGGGEPTVVKQPALSVCICIQPEVLAEMRSKKSIMDGSGLLARFLFVMPQSWPAPSSNPASILVEHGYIRPIVDTKEGPGRKAQAYAVNPKLKR